MILSYHPLIEADRNLRCAGRAPDETDAAAMAAADAVVLNQGCYETLFRMARKHCARVFPNYAARFDFPGKTGQIRLFQRHNAPHPKTAVYQSLRRYRAQCPFDGPFPAVFKFDWGGEGETVFRLDTPADLASCLARAERFEETGQKGFLIQEYLPHGRRTLRVVVVHRHLTAYWRVQDDPARFGTSVSSGARIDTKADPGARAAAMALVRRLCEKSGIDLAGFDLLVPRPPGRPQPHFLEVNYFFGRRGLGGSEAFYTLLKSQVRQWIQDAIGGKGDPIHGQT